MEDTKLPCHGVVVVGAGIAGKVRIRDLKNPDFEDGRWKLIGFVSRRELVLDGASQLTEDQALTNPDVHVMIICTEPGQHAHIIRKALNHGKHVLVEFPVAISEAETKELFALATEKGLVLHEENIALLTPGYATLKEKLQNAKSPVAKGDIKLIGNYNGWTEDFERSGGPFCVNVSLIQTLYKLFGDDITATGGQLEVNEKGFTATAKLSTAKCNKLTLTVRRTKERSKREKIFLFELEDGSVILDRPDNVPPPAKDVDNKAPKKPGLFMKDFLFFISEVNKKRDYSKDVDRVLHCIGVAEQIHKYMGL